jgi:Spy/CpxP family protein refolding chaperone
MKRLITLIAIIIVTVNCISAQPQGKDFPMMEKGRRIIKQLKLTTEQQKQFENIKADNDKFIIDIQAKIQKNRIDLKTMLDQNQIDEQKILQLVDESSKLQSDIKNSVAKRLLAVYKILDDKQKEIWVKAISRMLNHPEFMKERMKHGMKNWKHGEKEESK